MRSWTPGKHRSATAGCGTRRNSGHLFSHVRQILPCSPLADLNLNDTTFLSDKQWARIAGVTGGRYLTVYAQDFSSGCNINYNCITVRYNRRIFSCCAPSSVILDSFRGLVCTPVDHFPHSLHVACPFAFHQLLETNLSGCHSLSSMQCGRVFDHVITFPIFPQMESEICLGNASGLHLCQWHAFYLNVARPS